jgi:hypothetical protein
MPYLIVTDSSLVDEFQPLADWKTRKGLPAEIRTVDWIDATYAGRDSAERIRNYLKICYADSGLTWVLLGGDPRYVPDRVAFAMACEAGLAWDEDSLRADLYFSDLDGTWDFDGDGIFGEVEDSVDLYPDVFVGRASCEDESQVATFVQKTVDYERTPSNDYFTNLLFLGEILWQTPFTDGSVTKEMIDEESTPDRFIVTKLYETLGNENKNSVIAAINDGQTLVNHVGHGSTDIMSVGDNNLFSADVDGLVNGSRQGMLFSVGCWCGAFHYDAISEHFVNNPNGGGIAFVGMTSYGWGSPGNPGYGYSERFDRFFCHELLGSGKPHLGSVLATVKAIIAPHSQSENVYRWHEYQTNLLGDPELVLWTDSLLDIEVVHPDSVPLGTAPFTVIVVQDDIPVEGYLVCVRMEDAIYERDYTGASGRVDFSIHSIEPGILDITVSGPGSVPYEGTAEIFSPTTWIVYMGHDMDDAMNGNGDGRVSPGDSIRMPVTVKNCGTQTANYVMGILDTDDPWVTIYDNTEYYGTIGPGQTDVTSGFDFYVNPDAPNGHVIEFRMDISIWTTPYWQANFTDLVCAPILAYASSETEALPHSGDIVDLTIAVRNEGYGPAPGAEGQLVSLSPWLSFPAGNSLSFGDIEPDSESTDQVTVEVLPGCPEPHFADVRMSLSTSDGYSFSDTIALFVGDIGLFEGAESGGAGWTLEGPWHVTDHRSQSGEYSFYCGTEGYYFYPSNLHASLTSPPVVLGAQSCLSFHEWNELATYGVDGLFVEVGYGGEWDTLDMIASGGGLDSLLPIGNDWLLEVYDLSHLAPLDTVQIRFTFISDSTDSAEGFYIDNIQIGMAGDLNLYPGEFSLISPPDGDTAFGSAYLDWEDAVDPNPGDVVLYTLYIGLDGDIGSPTTIDSIEASEFEFSYPILDTCYVWTVRAYDGQGAERWASDTFRFYVPAEMLKLTAIDYAVLDSLGNGDKCIDPGETFGLDVTLKNMGWGTSDSTRAVMTSHSLSLQVLEGQGYFGDVRPGGANTTWTPFELICGVESTPGDVALLTLVVQSNSHTEIESLYVAVGAPGLNADMTDVSGWSHFPMTSGYVDEWHWSTQRFQSPIQSYKCGNVGGVYSDSNDAMLASPPFVLKPGSELTFFHWIDAESSSQYPGYCFDAGLVMLRLGDGDWNVIEPEGGYPYEILDGYEHPFEDQRGYSGHWPTFSLETFDLGLQYGPAQLGFRFGSDRGYGREGWYIDDVSIPLPVIPDIDLNLWELSADAYTGQPKTLFFKIMNVGDASLSFGVVVEDTTAQSLSGIEKRIRGGASVHSLAWIDVEPDSGAVPADSFLTVELTIDVPAGSGPDTLLYDINVYSDDPNEPWLVVPLAAHVFEPICGDANGNGSRSMADAFYILNYFGGDPAPVSCWAANVNGDDHLTTGDGYYLLEFFGSHASLDCQPCALQMRTEGERDHPHVPKREPLAPKLE